MSKNAIDQEKTDQYHLSGVQNQVHGDFQVYRHTDVHIMLFPIRKDTSFVEIRTTCKSQYESHEEFLISSVLKEEFPKEVNVTIDLKQLESQHCSPSEFAVIFAELLEIFSSIPEFSKVISAKRVNLNSGLNWLFVEDKDNYHSIFWRTKEFKALRLCAYNKSHG